MRGDERSKLKEEENRKMRLMEKRVESGRLVRGVYSVIEADLERERRTIDGTVIEDVMRQKCIKRQTTRRDRRLCSDDKTKTSNRHLPRRSAHR